LHEEAAEMKFLTSSVLVLQCGEIVRNRYVKFCEYNQEEIR